MGAYWSSVRSRFDGPKANLLGASTQTMAPGVGDSAGESENATQDRIANNLLAKADSEKAAVVQTGGNCGATSSKHVGGDQTAEATKKVDASQRTAEEQTGNEEEEVRTLESERRK